MQSIYKPLAASRSEIRVLILHAGKFSDPIKCSLRTVSLQATSPPPQYEALSYVWGNYATKLTISVDGKPFQITPGLEGALRRLRRPQSRRTIWADAICINQNDNSEKNTQVPLMGRLYAEATGVLVWLGESDENIDQAIREMRQPPVSSTPGPASDPPSLPESVEKQQLRALELSRAVDGFGTIFRNPYWTRMWTFQEYRLAKSEPILMYGDQTFYAGEALEVRNAVIDCFVAEVGVMARYGAIVPSTRALWEKTARRVIDPKLQLASTLAIGHVMEMVEHRRNDSKEMTFPQLLFKTSHRHCHDPRDKLYALYGMVPEMHSVQPPDYDKRPKDVMFDISKWFLNRGDGDALRMLWTSFALHGDRLHDFSVPSWVVDISLSMWTSPPPHAYFCTKSISERITGGDHAFGNSPDLRVFIVHARRLGPIRVLHRFSSDVTLVAREMRGLLATARDPTAHGGVEGWKSVACVANGGTLEHRVSRTLLGHMPLGGDLQKASSSVLDEKLRAFDGNAGSSGDIDLPEAVEQLCGKVVFVSETGLIGAAGSDIADSDEVVVSGASTMPIVVRRIKDSGVGHKLFVRMVGFAYVDGLIQNDCLDEELVDRVLAQDDEIMAMA